MLITYRKIYRGLDHEYLRLATFREILLSSSGKVKDEIFTIYGVYLKTHNYRNYSRELGNYLY